MTTHDLQNVCVRSCHDMKQCVPFSSLTTQWAQRNGPPTYREAEILATMCPNRIHQVEKYEHDLLQASRPTANQLQVAASRV